MRIANLAGRAHLVINGEEAVDVADLSGGLFGPSLPALYDEWDRFRHWADEIDVVKVTGLVPFSPSLAGPPSPAPRQVFALALNYVEHAAESGNKAPDEPLVFSKYVTAFSGPVTEVVLPEGNVDWECEMVAVIGKTAHRVPAAEGWSYVAGLTVGQDLSERILQRKGPLPQFALGKSYPGFAPTGPVLVTVDDLENPNDLAIGCEVNGQTMQSARTSQMIFDVPALIEYVSAVVTLMPGDVIFTGTPPGVGMGRRPPVFLKPGDRLRSHIEGLGELRQTFVAPS